MSISDNSNIRHIFRHYGIKDPDLVDKLFDYYKNSEEGKSMSLGLWVKDYLIVEPLLNRLLDEAYTIKTFNTAKIKDTNVMHAKLKKFFYENIALYSEFLLTGITEEVYVKFLNTLSSWLEDNKE